MSTPTVKNAQSTCYYDIQLCIAQNPVTFTPIKKAANKSRFSAAYKAVYVATVRRYNK